jgi:hypothetical protein
MVANFIMAESAREQLVTASGNKLTIPFVVLTPKYLLLLVTV